MIPRIRLAAITAAACLLACSAARAQETVRVSVDSLGQQANAISAACSISQDGRLVAFESDASNLVPGDTNGCSDIFIHDLLTGATGRVSVDSQGAQANGPSRIAAISADGRFVAFESDATNLVAGDTNGTTDVFVHDNQTGATTRVSVSSQGGEGDRWSGSPVISLDGRMVVFLSPATNLVAGDTNASIDVFLHDAQTGETSRMSVNSQGEEANQNCYSPAISADGKLVAFMSLATNLVQGDTNNRPDVFVHDPKTGATTRASVNSQGDQADGFSDHPALSADGRMVAFDSAADNLVPGVSSGGVFLHDRSSGETTFVSFNSDGDQAHGGTDYPAVSADGRFVVFRSDADNLAPCDANATSDIFVRDREGAETTRASVDSRGDESNNASGHVSYRYRGPAISADGEFVAFDSLASNLVAGDTNATWDIFVHHRQDGCPGDGFGLVAPSEVAIGMPFDLCLSGRRNDRVFMMASGGAGPTPTPYGEFCLDFPPVVLLAFKMPVCVQCLTVVVPCDPALVGAIGYLQYLSMSSSSNAGRSNEISITVGDGPCH
jgi:Tol biopolymer transport system component